MAKRKIPPIHPGEILLEEFIEPMGLSQNRLALGIGVPPRRINEIVHGKRSITADTALRLGRFFGMSPNFGLIFKRIMIWRCKRTSWALDYSGKYASMRPHDRALICI